MRGNRGKKGFTLMEMLVTIAIVAVLVAIIALFLSRNLNRSRAAVNSTNLRATRSLLAMELLADPENAEDVLAQVMSTAPKAEGVDLPGLSVPDGMPMDAIITEDGVDTFYGDYNEENFNDVYQDGVFDGEANRAPERETQEATQVTFCAVLDCFSTDLVDGVYCSAHQIKICTKSILNGDVLVPCGREYRSMCDADHRKLIPCPCGATGSQRKPCGNCGHWHYRTACPEMVLVQDNDPN